ncbi:hypothetical protein D9619_006754 [Psilocybe cf. subviscida]|uniref:Uncharacterized protein n=1 Tax=Psilocybe cf. subviscida TaxID=2480587 RepID=A0A8H5EYA7_9AGAR|nr:hypothetical protein D9619_006754 [Psilocybe cf. subviscida]
MAHLPPEIWGYITHFIPQTDIYPQLLGLNQAFLYTALDIKWREVDLWTRALAQTLRVLTRLRDPFIARRVQRLNITLLFHEPIPAAPVALSNSPTRYRRIAKRLLALFEGRQNEEALQNAQLTPVHPFHRLITGLLECTPHLINVSAFNFQLVNIEPRMPINHTLHSLLATSWKSFGHNLRSLSLSTKLEDFHNSSFRSSEFSNLTHLEIKLYYGARAMKKLRQDNALLVDVLAPFLTKLEPHLRSLKLILWAPVDYSAFFSRLAATAEFGSLRTLSLHIIDFDKNVHDHSGLRTFLCRSPRRRLRTLDLNIRVGNEEDLQVSHFLKECANEKAWLAEVDDLTMNPFNHNAVGTDALCRFIGAVSGSLTHLAFKEHPCSSRFAMSIVDALTHCEMLAVLELGLDSISIELVDRIAARLPNLHGLAMYHLMVHHDVDYDKFITDLAKRTYDKWALKEIAVYRALIRPKPDRALAFAVVRSTPGITTVFNRQRKKTFQQQLAASQAQRQVT